MRRSAGNQVALIIVAAMALFVAVRGAQSDARAARESADDALAVAEDAETAIQNLSYEVEEVRDDLERQDRRVDDACWNIGC